MDNRSSVHKALHPCDTLSYRNVSRIYFTRRIRRQITTPEAYRVGCWLVLFYYSIFACIVGTLQGLQGNFLQGNFLQGNFLQGNFSLNESE